MATILHHWLLHQKEKEQESRTRKASELGVLVYFQIPTLNKGKASSWTNADMNDGKQAGVGYFVFMGPPRLAETHLILGMRKHKEKGLWLKCFDPHKI